MCEHLINDVKVYFCWVFMILNFNIMNVYISFK
jgi:hypothetical protein